jgi:hypothetical protein
VQDLQDRRQIMRQECGRSCSADHAECRTCRTGAFQVCSLQKDSTRCNGHTL